ncbi:MAG: dihydroorotate dehydrogenase [Eubacteriales bacterium]|nr:dihydroorotate dehydrogenase [Eubacteriales bacterium]MDD3198739.1 dihydroorotate dehydrogenase [Eubacteriales bacterium]MDD4629015.1 dihydroorotate dehydrogenase [Eubacteriales bacterium]
MIKNINDKLYHAELDLSVSIAGVTLKNPVTTASGTFSARESGAFYDISELGAVITKGVSDVPWDGNPTPRIAETYGGMLNSVGLQNPGVEDFIKHELPLLKSYNTKVIVNVVGKTINDYCKTVEKLDDEAIDIMEINISCPNIKEGGISFGADPKMAAEITREIKRLVKKPIIMKLTPNVTDITEIAKAAEYEGADGVSLINTLLGMKIDVHRKKPVLWNKTGGLSGPSIKPVAIRMVYQVRRAVNIPIIGLGGIMTGEDAAEFLMAGADAVSVGTAALVDPTAPVRIKNELIAFMQQNEYKNLQQIRDALA